MKFAILASILGSAAAFAPAQNGRTPTAVSETKADLEALAKKLNPVLGYYDPLNLAEADFWGQVSVFYDADFGNIGILHC